MGLRVPSCALKVGLFWISFVERNTKNCRGNSEHSLSSSPVPRFLPPLLNYLPWGRDAFLRVPSSASPCFIDDDSDDGMDGRSLSSTSTKRSRYLSGNSASDNFNDEYIVSQGKCSVCGLDSPPTYCCIKCHKAFHEHCDNFRIENETTGICGSCLISVPSFR